MVADVEGGEGYGQYCPIARAVEVLCERWTLLIVRDLLVGTDRFNDLARGLPGLSRTLLSQRLRQLESAGIVARDGQRYVLTVPGRDLEDIVFGLGDWGARWAFGPPRPNELDPEVLLWWAHTRIDTDQFPDRRIVIAFVLSDPTFHAWFLFDAAGPSVCKTDPGFDVDATVRCSMTTLAEVWLGRIPVLDAMRGGSLDISGVAEVARALPTALQLSPVAGLVRQLSPRG